jgi:hypothetical protein
MWGEKNFITKAIGLFVSMDKMIGGQFEQGLTRLDAVVRSSSTHRAEDVHAQHGARTAHLTRASHPPTRARGNHDRD